jgi:hypothetical protein
MGKSSKCTISGGVGFKQFHKYSNMLYFETKISFTLEGLIHFGSWRYW